MTRLVSVAALTSYVRILFEADELLQDVAVEGEVTQTFTSRAGHIYFTLSDGSVNLKCVMFRGQAARSRTRVETGVSVTAFGRVSIYDRDASYQLYVDAVFDSGIGIQAMELERLRQRLSDDGLFDPSRKRELPAIPRVIGVVTSAQGAVWHDIQTVVERRFPLAELLLSPAQVQGAHAEASLVVALRRLIESGRPDVIIVARGGGSVDDLSAFNGEAIARAVFASPIPVVSAIGHETDWTILDEVADVRAATPTAAAELVTPNALDLQREALHARLTLQSLVWSAVEDRRAAAMAHSIAIRRLHPISTAAEAVAGQRRRVEDLGRTLSARVELERSWSRSSHRLLRARRDQVAGIRRLRLEALTSGLRRLGPGEVLGRGYAYLSHEDGRPLASVAETEHGAGARAVLSDGKLHMIVTSAVRNP